MRRHALLRAAGTDSRLLMLMLTCGYALVGAWLIVGGMPEPHRTTLFWAVQFPATRCTSAAR